eukprot:XP_001697185.1 predicted protein [Chlamydomonas reinhardtii]
MGTNFAQINKPGQYGVAPLPGSRLVAAPPGYDVAVTAATAAAAGSGSSSKGAKFGLLEGRDLFPCTEELCGLSHNHDLLYLQPTIEGAEAAAAASDAAAALSAGRDVSSSSSGSQRIDTGDSPLPVYAERERVAAARLKANLGAAVLPPLVNRAPYSVALDHVFTVRYQGAGVDTVSLGDMVAMQQWAVQGLSSIRARRQAATDTLRQALGYQTATGNSSIHSCNDYATWDWWRLFAPSQRRAAANATASGRHRRQRQLVLDGAAASAPSRNLSFLYADWADIAADVAQSGGSRDAAGFGGLYLHALWHATHSPNIATDMQSPTTINFFRYALDHGSMLLLPPNNSYNGSYSRVDEMIPATPAAVDAALGLVDRVWRLGVAAQGNGTVRRTYEASISAPDWQPPPVDNSGLSPGEVAAVATSVAVFVTLVVVLVAVLALAAVRRRRTRRNRDMLGRVVAPREGPDTTLLITDVQNSTVLWEALPVAVMDTVLKIHHGLIRAVLSKHDGYESATEGDSFILAFATPQSAMDFATECQVALLKADWPPALLDHPDGAPVLVLSPHDPRDVQHATATLAALGPLSPLHMLSSRHMSGSGVLKRGSPAGGGSGTLGVERSKGAIKHQAQQLQLHPGRGSLKTMLPGTGSAFGSNITAFPGFPRRMLGALLPSSLGVVAQGSSPQVHLFAPLTPTASPGEATVPSGTAVAAAGVVLESPFTAAGAPAANTPSTAGRPGAVGHLSGSSRDTCWVSGSGVAALFPAVVGIGGDSAAGANGAMAVDALCVHLPDGRLALVAFRGLRVRMGLHTGLDDPESVAFNKVSSAYAYKGPFAKLAKLISDAAPGGLILLSSATFSRLRNTRSTTGSSSSTAGDKAAAASAAAEAAAAEQAGGFLAEGDDEGGGGTARHSATGAAAAVVKESVASFLSGIKHMFGSRRAAEAAAAAAAAASSRGAVIVFAGRHVLSADPKPQGSPPVPWWGGGALCSSRRHRFSRLRCGASGLSGAAAPGAGTTGPTVTLALAGPVAEATLALDEVSPDSDNELGVGAQQAAGQIGGAAADANDTVAATAAARVNAQEQQPQPQLQLQLPSAAGVQSNGRHHNASLQHQHQHRQFGRSIDRGALAGMLAEALVEAASATQSAIAAGAQGTHGTNGAHGVAAAVAVADGTGAASPLPPPRRRQVGELLALMQPESSELVFLAVHPSLVCRLALAAPLRVVRPCAQGSLAAPVLRVTVVFMKVAGAALLLQDLPGPAARALDAFLRLAAGLLGAAGGYLVEGGDGLALAVFASPAAATRWALDTVAALKRYPWEEALLSHELCAEELAIGGAVAVSHTASQATVAVGNGTGGGGGGGGGLPHQSRSPHSFTLQRSRTIMQTGPRIKCGLDVGEVTHTLTEASGRLSYRGRPMNRAARIAGICAAGKVLVSGDVWAAACEEDAGMAYSYSGISLGAIPLKGVAQPIEVVEVVRELEQ